MDMKKVEDLQLKPFFEKMAKASKEELHNIADDINRDINNIADVVRMWSNNGAGWINEDTYYHAMDMCDEAVEDLPELETKLGIVKYFLRNK